LNQTFDSIIDELGGDHAAVRHRFAEMIDGFVDDRETVALSQVTVEIDVAAKNIDELRGHAVGNARRIGGAE
jgi:hypothetical protein